MTPTPIAPFSVASDYGAFGKLWQADYAPFPGGIQFTTRILHATTFQSDIFYMVTHRCI